ncbi:MAG: prepilin-type N-terminal cleavage/methylation domain-containing protein [Candidatus Riflebacteria bacterium]|nr:prepilin-type N-terminal cleavage/methylation domain-containing protein [Candidatus Riflebacteria bacterium]
MNSINRNNKQGFTMIEIMCVLIIISIVSSIALPAINNFHSSDRCKAAASILVNYIRQAKYQAMQDNCFNRIRFAKNSSDDSNSIFVETYEGSNPTLRGAMSEDNYWASIADEDEVTIDSSVEVDLSKFDCLDRIIYFKPDGFIYEHDDSAANSEKIISEQTIVFKYGSAAVAVDINALGVISSEAIPNEEDDFFDDKHNEGEDEDESGSGYNPPE